MSDGISDAVRAERQQDCLYTYYSAICRFLVEQTNQNRDLVHQAAEASDQANRDWRYSKRNEYDDLLDRLSRNDEGTWVKVLQNTSGADVYDDLLKLSPFRYCILLFARKVRYGSGVEIDTRPLERFIANLPLPKRGALTAAPTAAHVCLSLPNPEPGMLRLITVDD